MIFLYAAIYVAVVVQISNLCTTIYLHRYMSHHALKLHPSVAMAMQFWLWLHTAIDPREWVAVHRKHHQFPDEHGDPHSPKLEGLWKVLLTNAYLYRKEAANSDTVARYTRDIRTNRVEDFMHRQGYLGLFLGVLAAGVLLGPIAGIASFLIQAVVYVFLNGMINGACHAVGYKNFHNTATNLRWVAWLTAGEGLHNNHHHAPSSPKLSLRLSEIDPAWPVIRLLEWLKLCKVRPRLTRMPSS